MYNREVETYLKSPKNDLGQLSGYPGIIDSYIKNYKDALDAEIQLKLELKNDENQRLLDDLAEQKSNWYTQMSYILSVANAEWKKAEQRLNNDRNTWEQEFVRVYDNKIEEWNQTYRDFSESKAVWVKEQYMKASQGKWEEATAEQDINRENIIQQVFLKTGLISKINDAVQNMAEETDSYIQGLTSSAIFKRSLEVAGSITDNIGAGIKHTKQGNTINTQNDTWLKEALESSKQLEEHYEKVSAKLTEQQMADQLRATIDGYMAQIDARNEGMRDWEESLVLQNGYSVNGNTIQREIIIDSTLTKNIKKTQSVYAYENFRVARPEQEISARGSEDGKSLIESILDGIVNVKKWAEKIFGKVKDAKGNPVERTITKTKAGDNTRKNMENNDAQQLLEDYLKTAKEYDDNQAELEKDNDYVKYTTVKDQIKDKNENELKDWAKNNKKDNETYNKVSRQIVQIQDGAINEWIGYAPTLKEGEEFKINKSKWENIEYEGKGQMGLIMLDFQWNSIEEQNGLAELAKPMYDKKMWDDDGAWLQPPTVRSVADIALDIVGNATGQKWLGWVDDALFGLMDVSGGYKTAQEVGLELGKKALTQFVSSKIGNATEWAKDAAGTALKSASTAANVAAQAGISVASSYASSVTSSAINSFNIVDGQLKFNGKGFVESLYSRDTIAGALSAGVNVAVSSGTQNFLTKDGNGYDLTEKVFNTEALKTFSGLTGNAAAALTEYAISGKTTVNLINTSMFGLTTPDKEGKREIMQKGLFAVTFDKEKGSSGAISTAGFDMNFGKIATAMNGLHDITKITSAKISNAFGKNQDISTLNAVNMLGYTYSKENQSLANDIWNNKKKVEYVKMEDKILGRADEQNNTIYISDKLLAGGIEGSAQLASMFSHEGLHIDGYDEVQSRIGGYDTYAQLQLMFGVTGEKYDSISDISYMTEVYKRYGEQGIFTQLFFGETFNQENLKNDLYLATVIDSGWRQSEEINRGIPLGNGLTEENVRKYNNSQKELAYEKYKKDEYDKFTQIEGNEDINFEDFSPKISDNDFSDEMAKNYGYIKADYSDLRLTGCTLSTAAYIAYSITGNMMSLQEANQLLKDNNIFVPSWGKDKDGNWQIVDAGQKNLLTYDNRIYEKAVNTLAKVEYDVVKVDSQWTPDSEKSLESFIKSKLYDDEGYFIHLRTNTENHKDNLNYHSVLLNGLIEKDMSRSLIPEQYWKYLSTIQALSVLDPWESTIGTRKLNEIGRADSYKLTDYGRIFQNNRQKYKGNYMNNYIRNIYAKHNEYKYRFGDNRYGY